MREKKIIFQKLTIKETSSVMGAKSNTDKVTEPGEIPGDCSVVTADEDATCPMPFRPCFPLP